MPSFWTFVLYTSQSIGTLGNKWHEKVKFSEKNGCSPGGWELAGFQASQLFHGWSLVWLFLNSITAYELQLQDSRLLPAQCPLSCLSSLKCSGSGQFSRATIFRNPSIYDCLLAASCFPESAGIWYPLFSLTLQTGWNDRWKGSRTELWVSLSLLESRVQSLLLRKCENGFNSFFLNPQWTFGNIIKPLRNLEKKSPRLWNRKSVAEWSWGRTQRGVEKPARHLHLGISNKPTLVTHQVHPLIKE